MLKLGDFFQHARVNELFEALVEERSGLILVAGPDGHPLNSIENAPASRQGILPGGRKIIFESLIESLLESHKDRSCVIVTASPEQFRPARSLRSQIKVLSVENEHQYGERITQAIGRKPGLLVIDWLNSQSATMALSAAQQGILVLSQLNSILVGNQIKHHIEKLGIAPSRLSGLRWVISVRRVPTLCQKCRQAVSTTPGIYQRLQAAIDQSPETLAYIQNPAFYTPGGCPDCHHTGWSGDLAVCDLYKNSDNGHTDPYAEKSLLPIQSYLAYLALRGSVALEDWLEFDSRQMLCIYELFQQRDQALSQVSTQNDAKLAELTAARRVMEQRTRALVSLQSLAQSLLIASNLQELAIQICQQVCALCQAERSVLYYRRSEKQVDILAVNGWQKPAPGVEFDLNLLPGFQAGMKAYPFHQIPPGIDQTNSMPDFVKAGLCVPLVAQTLPVGWIMIHSAQKPAFQPGETALLQTFASQAALALQRAGLVEQLEGKIADLEAAQQKLAQKERLERELELARQVQQSVLPKIFPNLEGFQFGAVNSPARQVGGDFYDVFAIDSDHFGLAIADVSDKGMPAALFMTLTRSLLLAEGRRVLSPLIAAQNVNHLLVELSNANMFVTVFYGVVQRSSRTLRFVRAGHDRPLLLRASSVIELGGSGIPLGLFDDEIFKLSEETIPLQAGDRLVLYTDGLVDLDSPAGQNYERQNLINLAGRCHHMHPNDFCSAVFAELRAFQGDREQTDDMTLLVMEVE